MQNIVNNKVSLFKSNSIRQMTTSKLWIIRLIDIYQGQEEDEIKLN